MNAAVLSGILVGLSLGLTGGGGAIFAVPLLVYWIGIDPRTAVGISAVAMAATALVGAIERWWYGQVEVRTGLIFASAGMLTTPVGGWLGGQVAPQTLMAAFAGLMLLIAARMWRKAADAGERMPATAFASGVEHPCSRDAEGRLRMTTPCFVLLTLVGLLVGLLSGLFGVGGGFLIVPALIAFATMDVFRAVGTSLFVTTLVGAATAASQVAVGRTIPLDIASGFVGGSVPSLFVGSWIGRRIGGPTLARVFAAAIVVVAAFIIFTTLATAAEVHHAQGELAGEVTATSVLLQSRLTTIPGPELDATGDIPAAEGVAAFEWSRTADFAAARRTPWLRARPETDSIVRYRLEGLAPATTYHYRLVFGADEATLRPGPARRFRTLPSPDSTAPLSFTMGSCQNYAFFMRGAKGRGNGAPEKDRRLGYPAYAAMLSLEPDFFIGTGDIVYYDHPAGSAARTLVELRRKWHEQFRLPRIVEFLGRTSAYWSKDDHDFRFNDADLEGSRLPTAATGIDVFREQMPVLDAGDRTSPSFRTHRVHRHLQLWFTEGRDHRSPNAAPDGPQKSLWGAGQRAWLERTLRDSDATWRVIVSPTPMVGPDSAAKNDNHANLGGFRHEAEAFFAWAKAAGIDNLLIFCGDRHWQYHSIHPSGVEEFGCGALNDENAIRGVRPGDKGSTDPEGLIRQPFLYPEPTGGFLRATLDGAEGRPRLRIAFIDDEGAVLHTVTRQPEGP